MTGGGLTDIFLIIAFLFYIGSSVGWLIEVVFRRFFSKTNPERKWINPGFLVGPCLPLYGVSLCILYLLANCESDIHIENIVVCRLVLFFIMALCVTALEYLVGLYTLKVTKVRLWDYSGNRGNIKGIICPRFTFFWAVLSAVYYFLVHPHVLDALDWLSRNLAFSFFIGMFFGVFAIDAAYSTHLMAKIHKFADEKNIVVRYEELKAVIRADKERHRERVFLLAMHSKGATLAEHMADYFKLCFEQPIKTMEEALRDIKDKGAK